jgi:hypothetical protein
MFDKFFEFGKGGKETHAKEVMATLLVPMTVARSNEQREILAKGEKLELPDDLKKAYAEAKELLQADLTPEIMTDLQNTITDVERDYKLD